MSERINTVTQKYNGLLLSNKKQQIDTTWMNLKTIRLSDRILTKKEHIWNGSIYINFFKKFKLIYSNTKQINDCLKGKCRAERDGFIRGVRKHLGVWMCLLS